MFSTYYLTCFVIAAYAFIAQCSLIAINKSDEQPEEGSSDYDSWVNDRMIDPQKSLNFWRWWLTDALQEAWEQAAS